MKDANSAVLVSERIAFNLPTLAHQLGCLVTLLREEIKRGNLRPARIGQKKFVVSAEEVRRYLGERSG